NQRFEQLIASILPMTVSFIFLHLSIYTLSGIFFWKWIILDLAFCYLFIKTNRQYLPNVKVMVILFVLSIFCQAWSNPISLGWLDSKLVSKFTYTAVGISGKKYSTNPNYFEPYGILFAQQRFHYL